MYHSFASPAQLLDKLFELYNSSCSTKTTTPSASGNSKNSAAGSNPSPTPLSNNSSSANSTNPAKNAPTPANTSQSPASPSLCPTTDPPRLIDLSARDIAQQLTLDIWPIYCSIKPTELFNGAWIKPSAPSTAPNVTKLIQRFNFVSTWASSAICSELNEELRRKTFTKIVHVATYLKALRNYHLLYAVLSGISNMAIIRLKKTIGKIDRQTMQTLSTLELLMDMRGSYKYYRTALKKIKNTSCIPSITILLKDLIFIEDGNPDVINGLINWSKRRQAFQQIAEFLAYTTAPLKGVVSLVVNDVPASTIIEKTVLLDEDQLYALSVS
ncbi:ras guanine nucleotide exchange factor K-like, partial [Schistocerca gregaria]|uniref:ras guanine nucleotide exchange factor K-like n=1 Tax=Schistocerca gregaria TaxID=7010 RepID=UPI00211DFF12